MEKTDKGFTPIPHDLLNALLVSNLTKRELKVVLLIIRLTYGCHKKWAYLKQNDLRTVRISETHAKGVFESLSAASTIVKNGKSKQYKVVEDFFISRVPKTGSFELERLTKVIGSNLPRSTSQNGNEELPKSVRQNLPNKELVSSQNSNTYPFPNREVSTSNNKGFSTPKDIIKYKFKNNDKESIVDDSTKKDGVEDINPHSFIPQNSTESEAHRAWETIEPQNPTSFGFYIWAGRMGLPYYKFGEFTSEIMDSPKIRNKGAVFVKLVTDFLHTHGLIEKKGGN